MSLDLQGNLWLSDAHHAIKLNSEGNTVKTFEYTINPFSFDFDSEDHLVMADSREGIFIFSQDGLLLKHFTFSEHGVLPYGSNFSGYPMSVHVDQANNIYVTFPEYGEIQKYDARGKLLDQWGEVGSTPGRMLNPFFIATSPNGDVMVVEHDNNRVQIFSSAP